MIELMTLLDCAATLPKICGDFIAQYNAIFPPLDAPATARQIASLDVENLVSTHNITSSLMNDENAFMELPAYSGVRFTAGTNTAMIGRIRFMEISLSMIAGAFARFT